MRKERLEHLIARRGLTGDALSEITGISPRMIWRYRSGESQPTADMLKSLSEALGVSSDYLLGLVDDPTPHLRVDNLTDLERSVVAAIRRGDDKEAIRLIASH